MALESYNPIMSVDGASVPCPSSYKWSEEDLSESDAGRTEDGVMSKQRIGQVVKLEFEWQNVSLEDAAVILQAFDPEYITVKYLDAKQGKFVTSDFYVGNRSTPLYNTRLGLWEKISFNIIAKNATGDSTVSDTASLSTPTISLTDYTLSISYDDESSYCLLYVDGTLTNTISV